MTNTLLPVCLSFSALLGTMGFAAAQINSASEQYVESAKVQRLAAWCDAGKPHACKALANATNGQCASPAGKGGCQYDSKTYVTTYSIKAFN